MSRNPAQVAVSSATIGDLDQGRFGAAVDQCIRTVYRDIQQRPANLAGQTQKRKVQITLEFNPIVENFGDGYELKGVYLTPRVKGMTPEVIGNDIQLGQTAPDSAGYNMPAFNKLSSHNFNQLPLPYDEEEVVEPDIDD